MGRFSDGHRLFKGVVVSLEDEVDRPLGEGPQLDIADRFHYSPLRILEGDLVIGRTPVCGLHSRSARDVVIKFVHPKRGKLSTYQRGVVIVTLFKEVPHMGSRSRRVLSHQRPQTPSGKDGITPVR